MKIAFDTIHFLQSHGLIMATAESCTAGLIASTLAEVEGSGTCLDVGIVVYSPSGKAGFLGVEPATIEQFGLTSEEVAREMAEGLLAHEACCADLTVANTGIAGPSPPGSQLPAGTQCFAWSYNVNGTRATFSETKVMPGERNDVRLAAAEYALSKIQYYYKLIGPSVATRKGMLLAGDTR